MKKYLLALIIGLIPLGIFLFGSTLTNYFVSDDFIWLLHAKRDTFYDFSRYLIDSQGFFYRPFTKMYFFWMWRWFSVDPYPYHVASVFLHGINAILVYVLSFSMLRIFFMRTKDDKKAIFSFVTAILFFIHPIHQENILWISAVTELFPALFLLLALIIFTITRDKGFTLFSGFLFFLCFSLGLMSHEYVVIFPLLVFITHYFSVLQKRELVSLKQLICIFSMHKKLYVGLLMIDLVYLALRAQANSHWSGGDYSYNLVKLPFNFIGNLTGYIGLDIVGVPFIYFYQGVRDIMKNNMVLAGILLIVFCSGLVYLYWFAMRNRDYQSELQLERFVLYIFLFFVTALLPFLGLGGIAERYVYLPSFAVLLFLSLFLYWIIRYFEVPTTSYLKWYWCIFILIAGIYIYAAKSDQSDWKIASDFVYGRLSEFRTYCGKFESNQLISRVSPPNRVGRAWVFQVGYEQGANVLCDKNIKILLN